VLIIYFKQSNQINVLILTKLNFMIIIQAK